MSENETCHDFIIFTTTKVRNEIETLHIQEFCTQRYYCIFLSRFIHLHSLNLHQYDVTATMIPNCRNWVKFLSFISLCSLYLEVFEGTVGQYIGYFNVHI